MSQLLRELEKHRTKKQEESIFDIPFNGLPLCFQPVHNERSISQPDFSGDHSGTVATVIQLTDIRTMRLGGGVRSTVSAYVVTKRSPSAPPASTSMNPADPIPLTSPTRIWNTMAPTKVSLPPQSLQSSPELGAFILQPTNIRTGPNPTVNAGGPARVLKTAIASRRAGAVRRS
jgi:hypothetical protein